MHQIHLQNNNNIDNCVFTISKQHNTTKWRMRRHCFSLCAMHASQVKREMRWSVSWVDIIRDTTLPHHHRETCTLDDDGKILEKHDHLVSFYNFVCVYAVVLLRCDVMFLQCNLYPCSLAKLTWLWLEWVCGFCGWSTLDELNREQGL